MRTILIVEDDENLSRGIGFAFEKDGFSVVRATTLHEGQTYFDRQEIEIVLLDIGLPDGDGMELCMKIREKSDAPIIMLTVCDLETDEVSGFAAGADDYITKPFSLSVLRARVEALLRRLETKDHHAIHSGDFVLDTDLGKLYRKGNEIPISATEFRILRFFMNNAGRILSKEQVLAVLWDNQGNFVDGNTLSVNISRLRAKIEDNPRNPKALKTVHGMGYVWMKEVI